MMDKFKGVKKGIKSILPVPILILLFSSFLILAKALGMVLKVPFSGEIAFLTLVGSLHGILLRSFLRKKIKEFYIVLLTISLLLFILSLNIFITLGYILSNIISADIYKRGRNDFSEIKAVALGNFFFCFVELGNILIVNPEKIYILILFYPVSVIVNLFLLFGLKRILDLLPFMFSDEKLERLANLSHPLIWEMLIKAPGTYHHSVLVSLIAENLADRIGADSLLAKVGGMFHDIGKLINPDYFAENINGKNPHDSLKPEISAAIIKSHVTEGLALANKYNLPKEIADFIAEHQGTKLIKYFYYKALQNGDYVDERRFRYSGPKPRSKETAVVMIADTAEALIRSLNDISPEKISSAIASLIKQLENEGQLAESGLSEEELEKIEKALVEFFISYYHQRIKYPERPSDKKFD